MFCLGNFRFGVYLMSVILSVFDCLYCYLVGLCDLIGFGLLIICAIYCCLGLRGGTVVWVIIFMIWVFADV